MKRILTFAAFCLLLTAGAYAQYESDLGINNTGFTDPNTGELIRDPAEINRVVRRMQEESNQRSQSASSAPAQSPATSSSSSGTGSMNIDNTGYDPNYNANQTPSQSPAPSSEAYTGTDNTVGTQPPATSEPNGGTNDLGMYSTLLIGLGLAVIVVLFIIVFLLIFLLLRKRDNR